MSLTRIGEIKYIDSYRGLWEGCEVVQKLVKRGKEYYRLIGSPEILCMPAGRVCREVEQ